MFNLLNERLFNVKVSDLLLVKGERKNPLQVFQKVVPFVAKKAGDKEIVDDEFIEEEVMYETDDALAAK